MGSKAARIRDIGLCRRTLRPWPLRLRDRRRAEW